MKKNIVKQALQEGKVQLGTGFGQFRSPEVPRMLAAAGFQWAFIDTEHGGFDLETVQDICRVSNLCGLSPIVRVGDLQYSLVARSLDCGAQGIIFPRVESPFSAALARGNGDSMSDWASPFADVISFLHIRWPLAEPGCTSRRRCRRSRWRGFPPAGDGYGL